MKTVIHIGQHKTGTTSIQHFLQNNRRELNKHGVYIPRKIAGYTNPSHFVLNICSLNVERYSSKKDELVKSRGIRFINELESKLKKDIDKLYADATRKSCDTVVWSNEGLYLLNSVEEYQRLLSFFSDYSSQTEVICCFRDIESYKESYKKELVKEGLAFSDNPKSYRYIEPDSWLFDYQRKRDLLSKTFDSCTYFQYDPKDNIQCFLQALGINDINSHDFRLNVTTGKGHNRVYRLLMKIKSIA